MTLYSLNHMIAQNVCQHIHDLRAFLLVHGSLFSSLIVSHIHYKINLVQH